MASISLVNLLVPIISIGLAYYFFILKKDGWMK